MQLVQVAASLELQPKSGARATCQSLTCLMVNEWGQVQTGPRQAFPYLHQKENEFVFQKKCYQPGREEHGRTV